MLPLPAALFPKVPLLPTSPTPDLASAFIQPSAHPTPPHPTPTAQDTHLRDVMPDVMHGFVTIWRIFLWIIAALMCTHLSLTLFTCVRT